MAALGMMVLAVSCGGVVSHRDGEGPLVSFGDPDGFSRMAIDPMTGVDAWSFGMPLCIEDAGTVATLHEVAPTDTVGSGFQFAGAFIHEYAASRGETGIISMDGFPPVLPGNLMSVNEHVFQTDCTPGQDLAAELIVGLRMTGADGGGWTGIDLSYSIGNRDYVLQIRNEMFICGDSVLQFCGPPSS